MRYFFDLTGKRTKLGLSALAVGLLFCMTSCVTLRDADALPHENRPVQEPPETTAPVHDFSPPETEMDEPEPEGYPEYERTISAEALN